MRRLPLNIGAGIAFLVWALCAPPSVVTTHAQSAPFVAPGELLMSWHAGTYIPPNYQGKPLPVPQSVITVSVEAIHSGRLASLAGQEIKWYVNDDIFVDGVGRQTIAIRLPSNPPDSLDVRVELPNATIEPTVKTISIPVVSPATVIAAPFPDQTVQHTAVAVMHAIPYFFNAVSPHELLFSWTVNGNPAGETENPDELDLSTGSLTGSQRVSVAATIRNPLVDGESARGSLDLTATP